jgi:lipopolysaccharide transport system permease protein
MSTAEASAATAHAPATITIRPPSRWAGLQLRELWEYRELVYFLAKREIQIRYKQSAFGVAWAVLQPLVLAFVFALFFGVVVKVPSDGFPFAVFAIAGLVPWLFTAQAIGSLATSLVADQNLIAKVYFPRLAITVARTVALILDMAIATVVVVVVVLLYGLGLRVEMLLVPLFLALAVLTAFGVGTLFATVNVRYRDVGLAVPVLLQTWLFMTPVIYPASLVTGWLSYLWAVNPMVTVVTGARWALIGAPPPEAGQIAISVASAVVITVAAILVFRRNERFFADVI